MLSVLPTVSAIAVQNDRAGPAGAGIQGADLVVRAEVDGRAQADRDLGERAKSACAVEIQAAAVDLHLRAADDTGVPLPRERQRAGAGLNERAAAGLGKTAGIDRGKIVGAADRQRAGAEIHRAVVPPPLSELIVWLTAGRLRLNVPDSGQVDLAVLPSAAEAPAVRLPLTFTTVPCTKLVAAAVRFVMPPSWNVIVRAVPPSFSEPK